MIYLQNIEEYNYIRPVRDYLDLQNFIDSDEYTITADKLTSAVANVSIISIFQVAYRVKSDNQLNSDGNFDCSLF